MALLVVYVVWGSTYVGIRAVVAHLPPFVAASIRFFLAGFLLALFCVATRRWERPTRRQLAQAAVVGSLLMGIGNGLVMWSQQRIPSGIAALFVATFPLWLTAFEAVLTRGASLRISTLSGVVLGLSGVFLIASAKGDVSLSGGGAPWGAVLALQGASICWTVGYLYSRGLQNRLRVVNASALEMIAGSILLLIQSIVLREDWSRVVSAPAGAWGGLLFLTFFGSIVGFTAFSFTRHTLPTHVVGTYAYVNPLVAVLLGYWIYDESLSTRTILGGLLILGAVAVTSLPQLRARAGSPGDAPSDEHAPAPAGSSKGDAA
jgi:drug/metabolite transporter (DMT)-like permease